MRPIGDWSMAIILSRCSRPSMARCAPGLPSPRFRSRRRASTRMSLTSELLPEPETPVTQTNTPSGISTSMFFRLLCDAPRTRNRGSPIGPALRRHFDRQPARQVLAGDAAFGSASTSAYRAGDDDFAAAHAGAGTEIDDVIGRPHRVLVVLDHQHRVAHVAQPLQRLQQPVVVPRVQADRRLVQDVQHADQPAADLAGQADALRFAAGQRGGGAVQGQVVQSDVQQESQPAADFLEHFAGDQRARRVQFQFAEEVRRRRGSTGCRLPAATAGGRRRTWGASVVTVTARACGLSRWPRQAPQGEVLMYFSSCRRYMRVLGVAIAGQQLGDDPLELAAVLDRRRSASPRDT